MRQSTRYLGFQCVLLLLVLAAQLSAQPCSGDPCYNQRVNSECLNDQLIKNDTPLTLHMTVHPHLDAFWIFDFEGYYDPPTSRGDIWGYFSSNRFATVRDIFTTATDTLNKSKVFRETYGEVHEKARRTFVNSQMGFFKRWWDTQDENTKTTVRALLKTKYWEILGGGFVENDEAGAYYEDIIENYQIGGHFLEKEFGYIPKVAVSADSFGHSQSMAALLVHFGIEGFLVERSDEHILTKNKLEFVWKARSANGMYYGAIPTHVRWWIHGYQQQFIHTGENVDPICSTKGGFIDRMRAENKFLKQLHQQPHVLRYFGHDFQKFDDYSYRVIEGFMRQFSKEKCNKVIATYTNPTEYFKTLYREVFEKKYKDVATRTEDIFPIWDFDSGLYWTGYFTTDPYHKKIYRDSGRFLQLVRKIFTPQYLAEPTSPTKIDQYEKIQRLEEQVSYLQHHDGITCTSKYTVLDEYEDNVKRLQVELTSTVVKEAFDAQFPDQAASQQLFECTLDQDCVLPSPSPDSFVLNIFNSGGLRQGYVKVHLPADTYYSSPNAVTETVCFCYQLPCNCTLYIFNELPTYSSFILNRETTKPAKTFTLENLSSNLLSRNRTHLNLSINNQQYHISYKRVIAEPTPRSFQHINQQGAHSQRNPTINSGKYALGNNPNKISDWSTIKSVSQLLTSRLTIFVVEWNRAGMLTVLTGFKNDVKSWRVDTHSSTTSYKLADYYLVVDSQIKNGGKFHTDSNGWLVMPREMFKHEDYEAHFSKEHYDDIDGNTYPITAFAYIEDSTDKVSVNTDRPQGCIGFKEGSLWINFDRLSSDDGKWVWESTYRSDYLKFTHYLTVQNNDYRERKLQIQYDTGLFMQGKLSNRTYTSSRNQTEDAAKRGAWTKLSGLDTGNLKFSLRAWNDSTLLFRVHNLHDKESANVTIFARNTSMLLTSFYGNELAFQSIQETTIQGNQPYQKFIEDKWNWNKVIDVTRELGILDKSFSENITLRPLEIRAFKLTKPRFLDGCREPTALGYSNFRQNYFLNRFKDFVPLDKNPTAEAAIDYLLNQNHCDAINKPTTQWTPLSQKPAQHVAPAPQPQPQPQPQPHQPEPPKPTQPTQPVQQHTQPAKPKPTPHIQPTKPIRPLRPAQPPKPTPPHPETPSVPQQAISDGSPHPPQPHPPQPHPPQKQAAPLDSYDSLHRMVDKLVMLTAQQKREYFRKRIEELRNQASTC